MHRSIALLLALAWAGPSTAQGAPDSVAGLAAWYRADDLSLEDGGEVLGWRDASGNGHDLSADAGGPPAVVKNGRLAGRPIVLARKDSAYSVAAPIALREHTLLLVAATGSNTRALFRGTGERRSRGVVLRGQNGSDAIWSGGNRDDQRFNYGVDAGWGNEYVVLSLSGDGHQLSAFVDGAAVAGGMPFEETLELGKLFQLRVTAARRIDAADLKLAELVVYDRALGNLERAGVEAYLARKWGLDRDATAPLAQASTLVGAAPGMAKLTTAAATELNGPSIAIPWGTAEVLEVPFELQAGQPTRLVVGAERARVRLYASVPLVSGSDGALVRLLFRVNGALFLRGEGRSSVLAAGSLGLVRAETIVELRHGDYIEVLTIAAGAEGSVKLDPGGALFIAEER